MKAEKRWPISRRALIWSFLPPLVSYVVGGILAEAHDNLIRSIGEWTVTLGLGLWLIAALLIMSVRLIVDAIKIRD